MVILCCGIQYEGASVVHFLAQCAVSNVHCYDILLLRSPYNPHKVPSFILLPTHESRENESAL